MESKPKTLRDYDLERIQEYLVPFKGRVVDLDKPVQVYRNLGRVSPEFWSIRQGGKVVAHADNLMLRDVTAFVSKRGRERVLREKRKSIHAWLTGYLIGSGMGTTATGTDRMPFKVVYNPYEHETFVVPNLVDRPLEFTHAWVVRFQKNIVEGAY